MYIYIYIYIYLRTYIYIYIYTNVAIYIYIYIHTGWNHKIVLLKKKKHYSFILKVLLKKSVQVT